MKQTALRLAALSLLLAPLAAYWAVVDYWDEAPGIHALGKALRALQPLRNAEP